MLANSLQCYDVNVEDKATNDFIKFCVPFKKKTYNKCANVQSFRIICMFYDLVCPGVDEPVMNNWMRKSGLICDSLLKGWRKFFLNLPVGICFDVVKVHICVKRYTLKFRALPTNARISEVRAPSWVHLNDNSK